MCCKAPVDAPAKRLGVEKLVSYVNVPVTMVLRSCLLLALVLVRGAGPAIHAMFAAAKIDAVEMGRALAEVRTRI